jgi:hypothetical protein
VTIRRSRFSAGACLLVLAACSPGRTPTSSIVLGGDDTASAAAAVVDRTDGLHRWPADRVEITAAAIEEDSLRLAVQYGGGCAEHRFALVFGDAWMESYPVQVSALLSHDANGDNCRALLTGRIAFSLVPLRDAYRRAYRTDSGAVAFTVRPSTTRLVYRF